MVAVRAEGSGTCALPTSDAALDRPMPCDASTSIVMPTLSLLPLRPDLQHLRASARKCGGRHTARARLRPHHNP